MGMTPAQRAITTLRAYRITGHRTYQQMARLMGVSPESAYRLLTRDVVPKMRSRTSANVLTAASQVSRTRKGAR